MEPIWLPSPNFDSREGCPVTILVLHYTGMKTGQGAIDKLRNPESKVSAHYVVDEDGAIYHLVKEEMRAWHAGVSSWRGEKRVNHHSIGIEIVNPGHEYGYRPFPAVQMKSVIALCKDILARHKIPARNVVGHSDIAPLRKEDPGELFDWEWLAREGIGLWCELTVSEAVSRQLTPETLSEYGYDATDLPKAVIAFQRHFRPKKLDGEWDSECQAIIGQLLAKAV